MQSERIRYIDDTVRAIAELDLQLKQVSSELINLRNYLAEQQAKKQPTGNQVTTIDFERVSNITNIPKSMVEHSHATMRENMPTHVKISEETLIGWIESELYYQP